MRHVWMHFLFAEAISTPSRHQFVTNLHPREGVLLVPQKAAHVTIVS